MYKEDEDTNGEQDEVNQGEQGVASLPASEQPKPQYFVQSGNKSTLPSGDNNDTNNDFGPQLVSSPTSATTRASSTTIMQGTGRLYQVNTNDIGRNIVAMTEKTAKKDVVVVERQERKRVAGKRKVQRQKEKAKKESKKLLQKIQGSQKQADRQRKQEQCRNRLKDNGHLWSQDRP